MMRAIYAAVLTFFIICILLFVGSFIYMDREKHKVYYYEVSRDGCSTGVVRVDRFRTEDKLIYKSSSEMPLGPDASETKERITLSISGAFESYSRDILFPKEAGNVSIEKVGDGVTFVSQAGPDFSYVEKIPVGRDPFIFNESSPMTYLPIIEGYEFRDGGPQVFEALTVLRPELPPLKRLVTLTLANEEYIKTDGRKIKTEKLILKIRNYPQGAVWVAKSDKAVIKIDLPGEGLRMTRIFSFRQPKAAAYPYNTDGYRTENVTFKTKGAELSGTVSIPKKEGRAPALVLVWGDGPRDRSYEGFFDSISDYLAGKGLCVLRFDKRGIGASSGSYVSYSANEEIDDINAAVEYLASRDYVDASKIIAVGHAEGADPVIRAAAAGGKIGSIVLLSPDIFLGEEKRMEKLKKSVRAADLNNRYSDLIERCFRETAAKAFSAKGSWVYILGNRYYVGEMKLRSEAGLTLDKARQVAIPALIIQGRKDESAYPECSSVIDRALQEGGNITRVLVYYGSLGRFLGKNVSDCVHRAYYEADREMMDGIVSWVSGNPS